MKLSVVGCQLLVLLLLNCYSGFGQNIIMVNNMSVDQNIDFILDILVENDEEFVAIQFDLAYQNKEFIFDKDASGLTERANGHSLSITQPSADIIRVVAYSIGQAAFSGTSGSVIKLAFKSPEKDGVWNFTLSDAILGNAQSVNILDEVQNGQVSVGGYVSVSRPLSQGWTWFSVNVDVGSSEIADVLGSIRPVQGDYVKNQTLSSTYYDDYGWFGDLTSMMYTNLYKIKLGNADNLELNGYKIDPANYPITLISGWNWIGYLPETAMQIADALVNRTNLPYDYIKNQTISSTFYDGYGWFGSLESMQPLDGFMFRVGVGDELVYPGNEGLWLNQGLRLKANGLSIRTVNKSGVIVIPADFEYSGQLTAAVFVDNVNVGSAENELIAWVDGEARGITKGLYFSPKDHWVYNLMVYSNKAEGDTLEFSFYDATSHEKIFFNEELIFLPNMVVADAEEPYELRELRANTRSLSHPVTQSLNVFPNPVKNTATISYTLTQSQEVVFEIINVFGQVVERINPGVLPEGFHFINWYTEKLKNGVYTIIRSDNPNVFQKIILLK